MALHEFKILRNKQRYTLFSQNVDNANGNLTSSNSKYLKLRNFTIVAVSLVIGLFITIYLFSPHKSKTDQELLNQFEEFIMKYDKSYSTSSEYEMRFTNFCNNLKYIEMENSNALSEKSLKTHQPLLMKMNQFGDLTYEEFTQRLSPYTFSEEISKFTSNHLIKDEIYKSEYEEFFNIIYYIENPEEFKNNSSDLRMSNIITPVKDQMQCGSCWAFAAVGAFEASYMINNPDAGQVRFSEQELVDCIGYNGCMGGFLDFAFSYIMKIGISYEQDYPYIGDYQDCPANYTNKAYIKSYYVVPEANSFSMQVASTFVPVATPVCATMKWMFYSSGILDESCDDIPINHAVLVVGHNSSDTSNYFIVKNSWSESWGEEGYIKIANRKNDTFGASGIFTQPIIPIASKNKSSN